MRKTDGRAGFTLVEVMFALAILALAVVSLLAARMGAVRDAAMSRDARAAWQIAARAMAEALADPELDEGSRSFEYDEHPQYRGEMEIRREMLELGTPDAPLVKEYLVLRLVVRTPDDPPHEFVVETHAPLRKEENAGP